MVSDREEFERKLLALVSLPWLRYGSMPDWFRAGLIASLTPKAERMVRQSIEKLLVTFLNPPPDGVRLDYATQLKETTRPRGWAGAWQKLRHWWEARRRRRKVRELLRTEKADSPLQDFVFLTFMSGRHPRPLDVSVPDLLRRVLFPRGMEAFGPRPAAALGCAALISFGGWSTVSALEPNGWMPPFPVDLTELLTPLPPVDISPTPSTGPCANAPALTIEGYSFVREGDPFPVTAGVSGLDAIKTANERYAWRVTDDTGRSVRFDQAGGPTAYIVVNTAGLSGRTITARVSLDLSNFGARGCTGQATKQTFVNPRNGSPSNGFGYVSISLRQSSDPIGKVGVEVDGKPSVIVSLTRSSSSILTLMAGAHRIRFTGVDPGTTVSSDETAVNVLSGQTLNISIQLTHTREIHVPEPSPTPTPSATPGASPTPTSSRHGAVRMGVITISQAKELLQSKGFYKGAIDEEDDQGFDQAIRGFQKSLGMPADGFLGPATASKLQQRPPSPAPAPTQLLPAPKQIHPGNGAASYRDKPLEFRWGSVRGAVSCTIEVVCVNAAAQTRCGGPSLMKSNLRGTSFLLEFPNSSSQGLESYRWRVWAVDAEGTEGAKSTSWPFTLK